jgi:acyl-CoA reductase-like NAD-dependent aldehyde dehydrogenase
VAIANSTRFGLQAGVFTRDIDRAFALAGQLEVGGVMINDTSSYHADLMPYGGVKESGYGVEGPIYAVQDMTDPRIIVLNLQGAH